MKSLKYHNVSVSYCIYNTHYIIYIYTYHYISIYSTQMYIIYCHQQDNTTKAMAGHPSWGMKLGIPPYCWMVQ